MKVTLFGASGMVGQGVLRECLLDPGVEAVLAVGRNSLPAALIWPELDVAARGKLQPLVRKDLSDLVIRDEFRPAGETVSIQLGSLGSFGAELTGFDACFFCLGVSSVGMTDDEYRRLTYDLTVGVGELLARLNPGMTFIYVSGAGTDNTGEGRTMWARVKGQTENALMRLPFKGAYMFRPGVIVPMHGIVSRTRAYRIGYVLAKPFVPLLRRLFPRSITTTEQIGRAMLRVTREGYPTPVLEARDICKF